MGQATSAPFLAVLDYQYHSVMAYEARSWISSPGSSVLLSHVDPDVLHRAAILAEVGQDPIPSVLDTSYVRTGLQYQLKEGRPPRTISAAREGRTRIFMEKETLDECWQRMEKFSVQLGVPVVLLRRMFAAEWLPHIRVVSLPDNVRGLDERAIAVREFDPDDYPAAALAALLSPCILLTANYRDFAPLGVTRPRQGVDAVFAAIGVTVGERNLQTIAVIPVAPAYAVGAVIKWAYDKIGPLALLIVAGVVVGAVVLYRGQPEERRQAIRRIAASAGNAFLEQYTEAQQAVTVARDQLAEYLVPPPNHRSVPSAVIRMLATAAESLSAQQLYEQLPSEVQTATVPLRQWMHANKPLLFSEFRRGSFRLGNRYSITVSADTA